MELLASIGGRAAFELAKVRIEALRERDRLGTRDKRPGRGAW